MEPGPARHRHLVRHLAAVVLAVGRHTGPAHLTEVALEAEASGETADFSPSERTILQNVLSLGEKRVEDVMVPRADIEAIDIDSTLGDMVARFRTAGHSRIPVYADNIDNITGFIHVKDALRRITEIVTDPEKEIPVRLVSNALRGNSWHCRSQRAAKWNTPSAPTSRMTWLLKSAIQKPPSALGVASCGW